MTTRKEYFHLCSDGSKSPDFILSRKDFIAAMNIVALCAANTGVIVVAFTIEDTHPHFFLYGSREDCVNFKNMFESVYCRYAARTRDSDVPMSLHLEINATDNEEDYVRNIAAYTVIQPTKDGKSVMPFDYLWGSGSLYFRSCNPIPVWCINDMGENTGSIRFEQLTIDKQRETIHSRKYSIPGNWLVCNGIVLPTNYVDVASYEAIFRTHNCYRVFLAGSRKREEEILQKMAWERGIMLDDLQARSVCAQECLALYGIRDPRRLDAQSRMILAQNLRSRHRMTIRQIANLIRLPESEVLRYVP